MSVYLCKSENRSAKVEAKDKWDARHQFFREYGERAVTVERKRRVA